MISESIQSFLITKMKENSLSKNELSEFTGLSYPIIHDLLHANKTQPTLATILKIADSFQVSVDEVTRKKSSGHKQIFHVTPEQAMDNIRNFLISYCKYSNIRPAKLAQSLSLSADTLRKFVKTDSNSKPLALRTHIIEKIANHLDISIDEMIGRTTLAKGKNLSTEQTQNTTLNSNLTTEDLEQVQNIKAKLKSNISIPDSGSSQNKSANHKSFVEKLNQGKTNKKPKLHR